MYISYMCVRVCTYYTTVFLKIVFRYTYHTLKKYLINYCFVTVMYQFCNYNLRFL